VVREEGVCADTSEVLLDGLRVLSPSPFLKAMDANEGLEQDQDTYKGAMTGMPLLR